MVWEMGIRESRDYVRVEISNWHQVEPSPAADLRAARVSQRTLQNVLPYDFKDSERMDRYLNAFPICIILTGATGWLLYKHLN